jgi:Tol biopolymer transport system component
MILLVLIPAAGIAYLLSSPRLVSVSPQADANGVPAGTPLRLEFSRRMQPDSVTSRLKIEPEQAGSFQWEGRTLIFTPETVWPSGQQIKIRLESGARAAGLLSFSIREEASWSFRINQPRLAYLFPSDQAANIYVLNPLSGESQAITQVPGGVLEYDVSASGGSLYYTARNASGGTQIYRLDHLELAGSNKTAKLPPPVLVLDCGKATCRSPMVSPHGDWLAYERAALPGNGGQGYLQVWILPLSPDGSASPAGASETPDPRLAGAPGHQTYLPSWSSDGWLSFYDSDQQAFLLIDPSSGQSLSFANQTGQAGAWEPGGQTFVAPEISFTEAGNPDQTGLEVIANSHLIRFNRKDQKTQDLTQAEDLEDAAPAFSPDGKTIAFARRFLDVQRWTPGRQLYLMNADGSDAHPLTNDPTFNHYDFAWNPAGGQLAFARFDQNALTKPPEIWLIDTKTAQSVQVVIGGYAPQWIP